MVDKRQRIFKELKKRMNYIQDELGYEVLFIALQGSQNYGLDIYTDEYKSDIDCMAVILPSFDDFISNKQAVSTTIVLENNEHINIKDIRLMFELFYKQNPQFLELLFTDYKIVNKKYKVEIQQLFDNADRIASYNLLKLYNGISGMAQEKYKALEHPYPSIVEKINKYGYDGKQLHHIIRLNQFLINLIKGMNYREAMTHFDDFMLDMCMKAKLNQYSLQEARDLASAYSSSIHDLKEDYFKNNEVVIKDDVVLLLLELKSRVLKKFFKEELLPDYKEPFKLCPDNYSKVWVISDTHFGHTNILKYETSRLDLLQVNLCSRISRYIIDNNLSVDTDYEMASKEVYNQLIKEHDEKLISNWNDKVDKRDLVIILGDFSFKKAEATNELLKQLNGDKVLIKGNHDIFLEDKKFDKSLFKGIYDYKEVKYKGQEIALMHYPIQDFKHQFREINPSVLIFGHIHSNKMVIPKHSFNAGVEVNNFYPVPIEKAIEKALDNHGGLMNGIG